VEDARQVLDTFREELGQVLSVTLREEYLSRYGEPKLKLPTSLGSGRLMEALRLSPRYMKAGVREAAAELFSDPLFLAGVSTSVVVYFLAWAVPEPSSANPSP